MFQVLKERSVTNWCNWFLFQGILHYQINTEGLSWSYIFGQLEKNRTALNIVDYSVSQTTLEQVNKEYFFRYQNSKKGLKHQ